MRPIAASGRDPSGARELSRDIAARYRARLKFNVRQARRNFISNQRVSGKRGNLASRGKSHRASALIMREVTRARTLRILRGGGGEKGAN